MEELGACRPNHCIQSFVKRPSIFIGAIKANNLNPLPFQVHLRQVHDLLPPTIQAIIPPFE
jgi:hypothetical protein